jgi:hypothetical protein
MPAIESYTFDLSNHEDLANLIYNISPTETPFVNSAMRGIASNKHHEWEMDQLAAAAFNAQVEGVSFTAAETRAAPERLQTYTQISTKDLRVTGTQEAINKVGRSSELAYQMAKQGLEIRRDMERQLMGFMTSADATATIGVGSFGDSYPLRVGSSSVARVTGSVRTWIRFNTSLSATGSPSNALPASAVNQPADDAVAVSGTARALLESDVKAVIRSAWTEGGNPSMIFVDAFNKQAVSAFTGGTTKYDTSEDKKLVTAIDLYISDFGDHTVIPDRFLIQPNGAGSNGTALYALDMNYWGIHYLRQFHEVNLAKTADSENRALIAEWALVCKNPRGQACVADLIFS